MEISNRDRLTAFVTLDGSTIRELAGPSWTAARNQSLAEATVPVNGETIEHLHRTSEEIYYFVSGHGRIRLGEHESDVGPGDCIVIAPGTAHKLWAGPAGPLVLLCACSPAYSDADTVILGEVQ
jgi:mannose-6-phosphate isomerase-like protein (cupin superfamily)